MQSEFKSDLRFLQSQMMQQRVAIDDLKQGLHDPNYDPDAWRKKKELDALAKELEEIKYERKKQERLRELEDYEENKDMQYREELAQFQELQRKMLQIAENMSKPVYKPNIIQLPNPTPPPPPTPVYLPAQYPPQYQPHYQPQYQPQGYEGGGGYFPSPDEFNTQRSDGLGSMPSTYRNTSHGHSSVAGGGSSSNRQQQIASTARKSDAGTAEVLTSKTKTKQSSNRTKESSKTEKESKSKKSSKNAKIDEDEEEIENSEAGSEEDPDEVETKKASSKKPPSKLTKSEKEPPKVVKPASKKSEKQKAKENSKEGTSVKNTERTPRIDMSELRPEVFDTKEDDIVIYIKRARLLPDNMNVSKLYVYFYDQNDEEVYQQYEAISTLDSDIYNPNYNLAIRVAEAKAKGNAQLRMYILLVTVEELTNLTSSRDKKPTACIAALSLFPLFIDGGEHLPADKQTEVMPDYIAHVHKQWKLQCAFLLSAVR